MNVTVRLDPVVHLVVGAASAGLHALAAVLTLALGGCL